MCLLSVFTHSIINTGEERRRVIEALYADGSFCLLIYIYFSFIVYLVFLLSCTCIK